MIDNIGSSFSNELKQAISIAQSVAKEYSNNKIAPAHLLKGLLHKDVGLQELLMKLDKDIYYMDEWADVRIETYKKASKIPDSLTADDELAAVISEADNIRLKLSKDDIDPICVLASLSTPGVGFSFEQLKTLPITANEIIESVVEGSDLENTFAAMGNDSPGSKKASTKPTALLKYCIDKTSLAKNQKLDPVVARDREIRMMAEILGRRSKPNVIIVGDHGVGKTAVVNGFIQSIVENNTSSKLPVNIKEKMPSLTRRIKQFKAPPTFA